MMQPIVDPMFFYWCQICDFGGGAAFVFGVIAFVSGLIAWAMGRDGEGPSFTRYGKIAFPMGLILIVGALFVPTGTTLTKMLIARNVTPDNLKSLQGLAAGTKDSLKADIIDIIREVGREKEKAK